MGVDSQGRDVILIQRARNGDKAALEELVKKYTPMVRYIARNYYAYYLDLEDLVQEGMIGLLQAIREYDGEQYEIKFSSFAYICILRKIYNILKQSNGNKHRALNEAVSLFHYVNTEETRRVVDILESEDEEVNPEEVVEKEFIRQRVTAVLKNHLSLLEYTVITMLLQGYSYHEIEQELGVNAKVIDNARTRVRLKLKKILQKYGSLLNPSVPQKRRRREDLYYHLNLEKNQRILSDVF